VAFDTFIKLGDLKGESTRKGFEGQVEIFSFSFGASNPTTVGSGTTGMAAGKVSLSSFNIMKKTDSSSPTLFQMCCIGDHFKTATVTLNKASGDKTTPLSFLKYDFTEVYIDSIQWSGSSGGDDTPTESISLAFAKVKITYTPQKADGTPGSAVLATFDQTTVEAS
jgi:type VI secretion system secreted protein Hcp